MNVVQALSNPAWISGETWARPTSWSGTGHALSVEAPGHIGNRVLYVPGHFGGYPWLPVASDLYGNWELVTPDVVLAEREKPDA